MGKTSKGFWRSGVCASGLARLGSSGHSCSTSAGPGIMEHDKEPHECDQRQLVVKEMGDHGKIPSHRWSNEGILPGFQTAGISRRLEVQDPYVRYGILMSVVFA